VLPIIGAPNWRRADGYMILAVCLRRCGATWYNFLLPDFFGYVVQAGAPHLDMLFCCASTSQDRNYRYE